MKEYKSFGQILREQQALFEKQQKKIMGAAIEIGIANPPTIKLLPQMLDYEALIKDRDLQGEEEKFVQAIRALDMIVHMDALPDPSRCVAATMMFDVHILPRLDTPYPDRYGVVVISLLEEVSEQNTVLKPEAFTNRIQAVKARMSYGLGTVRNNT